jgi:hypothetical protein
MADLVYELLSQAVKNTNITINLSAKPQSDEPKNKNDSAEMKAEAMKGDAGASATTTPPRSQSGLVRSDLVQLISDLESVSATLKKINKSLVGHEYTEVFFMLQNFDKILTSVKMVVNAV